jgi:hypothetical protein
MKSILNIIMGFLYIIGDLLKQFILVLTGSITMFFTQNRKNNEFLKFMGNNCWLINFGVILGIFYIVSLYSAILGLIAAFISIFWFFDIRKNLFMKYDRTEGYSDGYDLFGSIFAMGLIIITLVLSNVNSAYHYEPVGKYQFTKDNFFYQKTKKFEETNDKGETVKKQKKVTEKHTYNNMVLGNREVKVYVKGCTKPGEYSILKETMPITYIPGIRYNFVYKNYYLDCSDGYKHYKKIKAIKDNNESN